MLLFVTRVLSTSTLNESGLVIRGIENEGVTKRQHGDGGGQREGTRGEGGVRNYSLTHYKESSSKRGDKIDARTHGGKKIKAGGRGGEGIGSRKPTGRGKMTKSE